MYKISTNLGKLQKKIVFCHLLCREPRLLKVHFWGGIGSGKWNIVHWQLAVMDNFTCKVANATQKMKIRQYARVMACLTLLLRMSVQA